MKKVIDPHPIIGVALLVCVLCGLFFIGQTLINERHSQPKPSAQRAFPMCADDEIVVNSTNDSLPHCVARADKDEFGGARSVWLHNEISLTDPCDPTIGSLVEVNGVLYICQNAIVWNSWPDVPPLPKAYIPKELQ